MRAARRQARRRPSRRSASRARTRSSIQLAGVHDPDRGRGDHRQDRAARALRPRGDLVVARRSTHAARQPIATPKLYDLLAGQQALAGKGTRRAVLRLQTKKKKLVRRARQTKQAALAQAEVAKRAARPQAASPCRRSTVVVTVRRRRRGRLPAASHRATPDADLLLPHAVHADPRSPPQMTGSDLKLSGTRQDFDPRTGEPIVLMQFTGKGGKKFEEITRDIARAGSCSSTRSAARAIRATPAALRDRARPRDPIVPADRLHGVPGRDRPGRTARRSPASPSIDEAKNLALVLQTGALPVSSSQLDQHRRLGDARQGLAARRRSNAAIVGLLARRALPAAASTASSASSPSSASPSTRRCCTRRSCIFGVTLTLPGFAGLSSRSAWPPTRTSSSSNASRKRCAPGSSVRAAISAGLREGLPHDRRRERRHARSPRSSCSPSRPRASRASR